MAETTADVRRDIEMTRERMSNTLAELERRLNVMEVVREHPWPAIAVAAGAGFALSGTRADVKAAAMTATAASATTERASRVGPALDDLIARLLGGVQQVLLERADELVDELRGALGGSRGGGGNGASRNSALAAHGAGTSSEGTSSAGTSGVNTASGATGASGAAFAGESRDAARPGNDFVDAGRHAPHDDRPLRAD